MAAGRPHLTLAELAAAVEKRSAGRLAASIEGERERPIEAVAPLESAGPADLSFLANIRYRNAVATSHAGAIVLTSAAWALMHVQYDWFVIVQIFLLGILFGWLRWASGSTILTIILHMIANFSAFAQTVIKVHWFS